MHTEAINFRLEFHVDLGLQQLIWTARFPSVLCNVVFRTALCKSSRAKSCRHLLCYIFFSLLVLFLFPEGAEMFNFVHNRGVFSQFTYGNTKPISRSGIYWQKTTKKPKHYHQNHTTLPEGLSKMLVSFSLSLGSFSFFVFLTTTDLMLSLMITSSAINTVFLHGLKIDCEDLYQNCLQLSKTQNMEV